LGDRLRVGFGRFELGRLEFGRPEFGQLGFGQFQRFDVEQRWNPA